MGNIKYSAAVSFGIKLPLQMRNCMVNDRLYDWIIEIARLTQDEGEMKISSFQVGRLTGRRDNVTFSLEVQSLTRKKRKAIKS
jgi:hypothetical protein